MLPRQKVTDLPASGAKACGESCQDFSESYCAVFQTRLEKGMQRVTGTLWLLGSGA